jgi:hypothetical protein
MRDWGVGRLAAELLVIVLGVLLALAADRWNQGRADTAAEAAYLERLMSEIRADSIQMEVVVDRLPARLAARDSLIDVLDGAVAPPDMVATVLAAAGLQVDLNPPNAWRELETASSLNLLRDSAVRQAVTAYYRVAREANGRNLARAQERGRDEFFTAMYQLGLFEPSPVGAGGAIPSLSNLLAPQPGLDVESFREWPSMRLLLNGLGGMYLFQTLSAGQLIREAGTTLQVLEATSR